MTWEKVLVKLKDKERRLHYEKSLNLYKRRRTFDGIYALEGWSVLSKYINLDNPLNILEIGTHEGQSTTFFLKKIVKNKDSKITCVDPCYVSHWNRGKEDINLCYTDIFHLNMTNNDKDKIVDLFVGTGSDFYKTEQFENNKYDIVYIDDNHTYENTKLNIDKIFPRLSKGSIMIFDDYDKKYYNFVSTTKIGQDDLFCDGVHKAVNELLHSEDVNIIYQRYQIIIQKN